MGDAKDKAPRLEIKLKVNNRQPVTRRHNLLQTSEGVCMQLQLLCDNIPTPRTLHHLDGSIIWTSGP
jgi:hypothetical protein